MTAHLINVIRSLNVTRFAYKTPVFQPKQGRFLTQVHLVVQEPQNVTRFELKSVRAFTNPALMLDIIDRKTLTFDLRLLSLSIPFKTDFTHVAFGNGSCCSKVKGDFKGFPDIPEEVRIGPVNIFSASKLETLEYEIGEKGNLVLQYINATLPPWQYYIQKGMKLIQTFDGKWDYETELMVPAIYLQEAYNKASLFQSGDATITTTVAKDQNGDRTPTPATHDKSIVTVNTTRTIIDLSGVTTVSNHQMLFRQSPKRTLFSGS